MIDQKNNKGGFRVQWHLTERCNLKCLHCYQDEVRVEEEMTFEEIRKAIDMLKKTVQKWERPCEVSLTGGEPFLWKDWFSVCRYLDEKGFFISILSNGTLIDTNVIDNLKELKNLRYVQISLDGSSAEVHDMIRGNGMFDKAVTAIFALSAAGIKVAVKFTAHKLNLKDLKNYLDFTEQLGVNYISVARYIPWGFGKSIENKFLSKKETKEVYELVLRYAKKNKGKILYDLKRPLWILLNNKNLKTGGRCIAGLNGLTVLPNGDVMPCRPMSVVIGNVKRNTFFEIWYLNDLLWKIRNYKGWACGSCEQNIYCGGCLAMSKAVHRDFFVNDPQCFKELVK